MELTMAVWIGMLNMKVRIGDFSNAYLKLARETALCKISRSLTKVRLSHTISDPSRPP
ncbi:MAG: hypothetical protein BroJett012_01840 [Betaproteobacteria bacterium]|nr:MAG: hypothetical protein BroJett012_01840 [Betaproteobacteria bacterium]